MKKETYETIKKESKSMALAFLILLAAFKIAFFNENFFQALRMVSAIFWSFTLPGFFIMAYWHDRLEFVERLAIGTAMGFAFVGIISYYLGIAGLNIKYQTIILPPVISIIGILIIQRKHK